MKKFKSTKGFTLVELIVVIAILAILTGVAVPAYKGYVEKADLSADDQLLGHVNKAFASACAVNGIDNYAIADGTARLEWNDQEVVGVVVDTIPAASAIRESFDKYFETDDAEFRILTEADIEFKDGVFTCDTAVVGFEYNGVYISVSKEDIEALAKDNTFATIGTSGLLDQVNKVTEIATGMAGSLMEVFKSEDFDDAARLALGVSSDEEYEAKRIELIGKIMTEYNIGQEEAVQKLQANSAVLYAAKNASKYDSDKINNLFNNTTRDELLKKLNGENPADGMADAALVYGMYYAYTNSGETDPNKTYNANNPAEVLDAFESDSNFKKYVNSKKGEKDMKAYLSSLNMINDAADTDPKVVEDLMVNGFNNKEFKNVVAGVVGH